MKKGWISYLQPYLQNVMLSGHLEFLFTDLCTIRDEKRVKNKQNKTTTITTKLLLLYSKPIDELKMYF